jgi:ATP-dependent DNA ligase
MSGEMIAPPYPPMEARSVERIPAGAGWLYEPKWDGFRCLGFRDGNDVALQSKSGQPLERYFPEIVTALRAVAADRFVVDGELIVSVDAEHSFGALLQRIHPAASRVRDLASLYPARYWLFDLLVAPRGHSMLDRPLRDRRAALERFAEEYLSGVSSLRVSPATPERAQAEAWLAESGGAFDGVVAKLLDHRYESGNRDGMVKVKRQRAADCVVGGFRTTAAGDGIGSLLLGLYDRDGLLQYVGFASAFGVAERRSILQKLMPLVAERSFTGHTPGGQSRWNRGKDTAWTAVEPRLVLEVGFDRVTSGRIRHGAKPLRWRPDKSPQSCTVDQLETARDRAGPDG